MIELKELIKEYNETCVRLFDDDDVEYYMLAEIPLATDEQIWKLEEKAEINFPAELVEFYKTFGGLRNKGNRESYCFDLNNVPDLIKKLKTGAFKSLGLIDVIRGSWGNHRPELANEEWISNEKISLINEGYKCIGWYRDDTILESAYYVYFNSSGQFDSIFYDQDEFHELLGALENLLQGNQTGDTLENILSDAIEQTQETMTKWNE